MIEIVDIKIIVVNVITKDNHLGIVRNALILPVIVHNNIDNIIEANNKINISFRLHKIKMEIIKVEIDSQTVGLNLNFC